MFCFSSSWYFPHFPEKCVVTEMPSTPSRRSGRSAARSPHAHPDLTEQRELAVSSQKSASPTVVSPITVPASGSFLRVWMVIALFLFAGTALSITVHSRFHGFNPLQASLAFFLTLNVLICFWEISLGLHIMYVIMNPHNRCQLSP